MGGFFLLHHRPGAGSPGTQTAALSTFAQMGFAPPRLMHGDHYTLAVFPKRGGLKPVFAAFANGDFIATCGTLMYDNAIGEKAAIAFYRDSGAETSPRDDSAGHYVIILRKSGQTRIIADTFGGYHLYYDTDRRIISSSFMVVASTRERVTLGLQSAYEYVFNGVVSGNASLFDEVALAPINAAIDVKPYGLELAQHPVHLPMAVSRARFEETVEQSMALLDGYFGAVAENFGDRVSCALSGGYDSRLILAMLRRHGVKPRVYVYGPPNSKDVTIASNIAAGEGFALDVVDKESRRIVRPEDFAPVVQTNFWASDGYSWAGVFDNGAEHVERGNRVSGGAIALNGGGGEIWRNFFYLRDRSYEPREILWSFYSRFDPTTCTGLFDQESYFRGLEDKLAGLIGDDDRRLPRPLIEWLYHNFRCRAWDGRINSINNTYGSCALPFLERRLTEHASAIPTPWKDYGAYEAELIRRADKVLAGYASNYGHNFTGSPPPFRRFVDCGTYVRPPWLRRFSYRLQRRMRSAGQWHDYLRDEYRAAALPGGVRVMSKLFHLSRINDADQMARILSLEYLIAQFDCRLDTKFDKGAPRDKQCVA